MARIYCFFCENCGDETLSFDALSRCPYCHANHSHFRLLAQKEGDAQDEFRTIIEHAKTEWMNGNHKSAHSKRRKAH